MSEARDFAPGQPTEDSPGPADTMYFKVIAGAPGGAELEPTTWNDFAPTQ